MKPTAFGKYLLLERIAVGGMAEVFLAKSFGIEGFERILAIKRILPQLAEDTAFIGMFIDEARIAGQLGHANVTPIYELGKVGSAHYIAMEHVWGKDLLQIMNRFRRLRTRMPAGMVAFIGARMCEALDYAHNKRDAQGNPLGLIHRDVSPQNVLVSYDGAVKLIDFGVAKAKTRTTKTQAGVVKGKFGYMSPEQVKGKKIDHRSDIFALGTCLYEMLTLERLFAEDTDFATMEKIRKAKLPPPSERSPGVPASLDDVVMKALTKDPAKRYQSAAEVQEALTRVVIAEEPRLSTGALADWMQKAFAEEMADEKRRLDSYARVKLRAEVAGEPSSAKKLLLLDTTGDGQRPSDPIAPSESTGDANVTSSIDETIIGPMPIELPEEAWPDEPTQIFFSADPLASDTATGDIPAPVIASLAPQAEPDTRKMPAVPPGDGAAKAAVAPVGPASGAPSDARAPGAVALPDGTADESGHDWSAKEPPTGWLSDGEQVVRVGPARANESAEGAANASTAALPAERTPRLARGERPKSKPSWAVRPGPSVATWKAAAAAFLAFVVGVGVTYLGLETQRKNGRLEVYAYPEAPSRVRIDGVDVGAAPFGPRVLRSGTHVVEVQAQGFRSVTRPVIVRPESTVSVHVELAPDEPSGVSRR